MARSAIADDVVRARVNSEVKQEAAAILASIGLTPSDAYRMLLARIVEERALPFEPLVPNETTIAAIREARSADGPRFASVEDLMSDLNADD
jgi:DNA-damage-inducible protein J